MYSHLNEESYWRRMTRLDWLDSQAERINEEEERKRKEAQHGRIHAVEELKDSDSFTKEE
jgi:hypothetical protein